MKIIHRTNLTKAFDSYCEDRITENLNRKVILNADDDNAIDAKLTIVYNQMQYQTSLPFRMKVFTRDNATKKSLDELFKDDLSKDGVYMLISENTNQLYIGYTGSFNKRFLSHVKTKSYWDYAIAIPFKESYDSETALLTERFIYKFINTDHMCHMTELPGGGPSVKNEKRLSIKGILAIDITSNILLALEELGLGYMISLPSYQDQKNSIISNILEDLKLEDEIRKEVVQLNVQTKAHEIVYSK